MGRVRIILLVVAAVAALGLGLVVHKMAAPKKAPLAPTLVAAAPVRERPTVNVLVASHDLEVGTRLAAADVRWQTFPADSVSAAFITDGSGPSAPHLGGAAKAAEAAKAAGSILTGGGAPVQAVTGAIVREPILASEPVLERKLVRSGEGNYMSVILQPGMRAVAIPVTVETGAGGFILPGDRVDVMMSKKVDSASHAGEQTAVAETVMRNLRVLAIDQQVKPGKDARSIVGATATLEVPAQEVEGLLRAKSQGDLALALRSYADMAGASGAGEAAVAGGTVKVIRAGRVSEVMTR